MFNLRAVSIQQCWKQKFRVFCQKKKTEKQALEITGFFLYFTTSFAFSRNNFFCKKNIQKSCTVLYENHFIVLSQHGKHLN